MKKLIVFSAVLFGVLLLNTFHEEYPDEYDSLVGGRYLMEGKVQYRDWYQHHMPGAYTLASIILRFSGISFVRFRIGLAVSYFFLFMLTYWIIRRRIRGPTGFFGAFLILIALGSTYFWGQMLLADTLAMYLSVPALAIIIGKSINSEKLGFPDVYIIVISAFLIWFTSMTYSIFVAGLLLYAYSEYISLGKKIYKNRAAYFLKGIIIFLLPFLLYAGYVLISGSAKDWWFANITYNQNYYIYNYDRMPGTPVNPVRLAIVIANTFFNNFLPVLSAVFTFPLGDPLRTALSLSITGLIVLMVMKRKFSQAGLILFLAIYANARSNPMDVRMTDYQASMYIGLGLLASCAVVAYGRSILTDIKSDLSHRILAGGTFLLTSIYLFFTYLSFWLAFIHIFYPKYMGKMPLIYDRPEIAPVLNRFVKPDDFVYIGPFEFKDLFYLNTDKQPSKYHWFLNHAATSKIKDELIEDLKRNKPIVIVFRHTYAPWGGDPKSYNYFITDFLATDYFRIFEQNETPGATKYRWKINRTENTDYDGMFHFDKERKDEILKRLLDAGVIEKAP